METRTEDREIEHLLKSIKANSELMFSGYHENVEYVVKVTYHEKLCEWHGHGNFARDCDCEIVNEKRVRQVKRPGYLEQLKDFAAHKDTDRNAKAERGAPRVKVAGKPPGDLAGFFALDEIATDVYMTIDRILEEGGRDRTWASGTTHDIFRGIDLQAKYLAEAGRPDLVRSIDKAVRGWVAKSRSALKITVGDAMFDGTVCGNCGGGLATPWGNVGDSDIRCVGTPTEPPCGHTYPMSEWMSLYEGSRS